MPPFTPIQPELVRRIPEMVRRIPVLMPWHERLLIWLRANWLLVVGIIIAIMVLWWVFIK